MGTAFDRFGVRGLALAAVAAAGSGASGQNVVQNGSFETPVAGERVHLDRRRRVDRRRRGAHGG